MPPIDIYWFFRMGNMSELFKAQRILVLMLVIERMSFLSAAEIIEGFGMYIVIFRCMLQCIFYLASLFVHIVSPICPTVTSQFSFTYSNAWLYPWVFICVYFCSKHDFSDCTVFAWVKIWLQSCCCFSPWSNCTRSHIYPYLWWDPHTVQ